MVILQRCYAFDRGVARRGVGGPGRPWQKDWPHLKKFPVQTQIEC